MNHYFTNNEELKSEIRYLTYRQDNLELTFASDNGVFAKDKIDYGSKLLVETFQKYYHNQKEVLDLGCGYGFIGLTLKKLFDIDLTMVDVNKRAIHLVKMNAKSNNLKAEILLSDGFENITQNFDVIITNPPIRAGKKVVYEIVMKASKHLEKGGKLFLVIRKEQGAKSLIVDLEKVYNVEVIVKKKGFYVIKCELK